MAVHIEERGDGLQPGASQVLLRTDIAASTAPYDVTPDGKRFVVVTAEPRILPITLVANWTEALKQK